MHRGESSIWKSKPLSPTFSFNCFQKEREREKEEADLMETNQSLRLKGREEGKISIQGTLHNIIMHWNLKQHSVGWQREDKQPSSHAYGS